MNDNISINREEALNLLKKAYSSGVFSYMDLADANCQKILNDFIESKFNSENVSQINLKFNNKISTNFSDVIVTNSFFDYTASWASTNQ